MEKVCLVELTSWSNLPPIMGVDHAIELVPSANPPARAPYWMAIPELKELRKQFDRVD